jgi:Zn-dependent protease with chaperone function
LDNASLLAALGGLLAATVGLVLGTQTLLRQISASQRLAQRVTEWPTASPAWMQLIVARVGLEGRVLVLDTPERFSFTYGMLTPHVAVSRGLLEGLSCEELRAVLEHERYHVRNLDPLKSVLVQTTASAFYFLPALHSLRARYTAGRELAADRWAIRACGPRPLTGALLKAIRGPTSDDAALAAASLADPGLLDIRIDQLESGREPKLSPLTLTCIGISLAAATLLVFALLMPVIGSGLLSTQHTTVARLAAGTVLDGLYCALPVAGAASLAYLSLARRAGRPL